MTFEDARAYDRLHGRGRTRKRHDPLRLKDGSPSELQHHIWLAEALSAAGIWFLHVPNEGKRDPRYVKAMGVCAGWPDFTLLDVPPGVSWAMAGEELKAGKNKPTRAQLEQIATFHARGLPAAWDVGWEAALVRIRGWGYAL